MKRSAVREKRRNRLSILLLTGLIVLGLAAGIISAILGGRETKETSGNVMEESTEDFVDGTAQIDSMSVIEDKSIYDADDPDSVVHFYVTVRYGSEARGTNHTFSEVNNVVRFAEGAHADIDVYADALVQVGDENGPLEGMLGFGESESNAMIRVRGNSSSASKVKSYKLSLDNNAGTWRGQSNIALNKHVFDPTRFRNKLYFDTLKEIDEIPSLRTQFVVLHVKDETAGETEFSNYGLFTQVEVPTKKYLKNHGLDASGYLYKVISFNWEPNTVIRTIDDTEYDAVAMDRVLSSRGREDNQKIIDLINIVNDTSVDINYIIDTYFDRKNYISWLAYNILIGNRDTTMQNYYLYSPLNGNKWYFIPWDGDGALWWNQRIYTGTAKDYGEWECGISNYWGILLHQRFLKYASNREELAERVEELYSWLNKDYIAKKIKEYNKVVEQYVSQTPDLLYLGYTLEERNYIMETLGDDLDNNYAMFKKSLTALMPFWIFYPVQEDGRVMFQWEDAYDFEANSIEYDLTVSAFPDMRNPIIEETNLDVLTYTVDSSLFTSGNTYYIEVKAYTKDRSKKVDACNKIEVNDVFYPGVYSFTAN